MNTLLPADLPQERHDLKIMQALRRIIRSIDINSRKLSATHDITSPQLVALLAVVEHGPITIAGIAKEIHLSPSTLVGIIDRLEKKALIERVRDTKDRRKVFIHPTEKGKNFATEAPAPLQDKLAKALDKLDLAEQAVISQALEHVVEMLEADEIDAAPILETGKINTTHSTPA